MKIYFLIYFISSTILSSTSLSQVITHGITFPESYYPEKNKLILNGAGVRKKGPVDLYVAGLYTISKEKDPYKIIDAIEPMAIKIVITSGMVSSKRMDKAIHEGFSKSTRGDTAPFEDRIDTFSKALSEDITKGTRYDLVFLPDKNIVRVLKNDQPVTEIKGLDFKKVLFGIWLGDDPVDKNLKKTMLGEEYLSDF
jgi:hypothetical protein